MPSITMLDGTVHRAGSEPLQPRSSGYRELDISEASLRANNWKPKKPTAQEVMMTAMETNPFVYQQTTPPGMIAGLIPIYPVYGKRSGRVMRADPEGSVKEKFAIRALRDYIDDCGSQASLLSRHFAMKRAPGELVQVQYELPDGRVAYEVVHNHKKVISQNRNGSWTWFRDQDDKVIIDADKARRSYTKSYTYMRRAMSPLLPLVDLLAAWELCHRALTHQVRTGMFLGGIIVGPEPEGDLDWTKDWYHWIKQMAENDTFMMPYPMAVPAGAGKDVQFLNPGMSLQDSYFKLEEMLAKSMARYSGQDPSLVHEGTGAASHWNGILLKRDNLQSFIWPFSQQQVISNVEAWPWKPALAESGLGFDVDDWGIDGDWRQIAIQPDQLDKLIELGDKGIIPDELITDSIGIEPSHLLEPGKPGWGRWEARQRILQDDDPRERVPDEPVGVGGETNGNMPTPDADVSDNRNPTQRADLQRAARDRAAAMLLEATNELEERGGVAVLDRPRAGEEDSWSAYGTW